MVNIFKLIKDEKEKFLDRRTETKKAKLMAEHDQLVRKTERAEKLAKIDRKNIALEHRIGAAQAGTRPSKFKRFGKGLAKVVNKQRAEQQKKNTGGLFGGNKDLEFTGGGGSPFAGQKNIDVGGKGLAVGPSVRKEIPKPKAKRVMIVEL